MHTQKTIQYCVEKKLFCELLCTTECNCEYLFPWAILSDTIGRLYRGVAFWSIKISTRKEKPSQNGYHNEWSTKMIEIHQT